jgi:hypothetical protein
MASYLFVSAQQPTIAARIAGAAPEPIDLCVTSPSATARATAAAATNGRRVFTVDEPLLAARERHESIADVMARSAEALRAIAAYDTRSALVVCDELGVLGLPAVGLDEAGLLKTADHIERMLPLP